MAASTLRIQRLSRPDEDDLIRVSVRAENEAIAARGWAYTSPNSLSQFAGVLASFPRQIPDTVAYSMASGECSIAFDLATIGRTGSLEVTVRIESGRNAATISILSEPGMLNVFGQQVASVASLTSDEAELKYDA